MNEKNDSGVAIDSTPLLAPLDAPETAENNKDDVSSLLTPEQRIWLILFRASQPSPAYCKWVPRWAWNLYRDRCPNMDALRESWDEYRRANNMLTVSGERKTGSH